MPAGLDSRLSATVYPRAYGGTVRAHRVSCDRTGLSPRVRGNLANGSVSGSGKRSIPARTGEPLWVNGTLYTIKVYPRAYGGTSYAEGVWCSECGLSPRVRGNPSNVAVTPSSERSIPARTGEPYAAIGTPAPTPVYPRAYGGTVPSSWRQTSPPERQAGLSPRVRGNQREHGI